MVRVFVWMLVLLCGVVQLAAADFDKIKGSYFALKNTDPELKKEGEWRKALLGFAALRNGKDGDRAIFFAADSAEELYKRYAKPNDLKLANRLFTEITERYPDSKLADDALIRMANITTAYLDDDNAAEKLLQKVLRDYPDSDMAPVAEKRLYRKYTNRESVADANLVKGDAPLIVLDPGHGGEDNGAEGLDGVLYEKDIVLDVARKAAEKLKAAGFRVALTRNKDEFVPLLQRMEFANQLKAKLFVSLHVNSNTQVTVTGIETYVLDSRTSDLTDRENRFYKPTAQSEARAMLGEVGNKRTEAASLRLAQSLQSELARATKAKNLGVKKAMFYVLSGATMPAALVELMFASNQQDAIKLTEESYRNKLADGLVAGIKKQL